MKTIVVKSQSGFEKAKVQKNVIIEIRSPSDVVIEVRDVEPSSVVHAYDSSTVTACESSTVTAYDSSSVTASGSSSVTASDSSTVYAYDSSTVTASDSSTVYAYDSSTVSASDSSTVYASGSSTVSASGSSRVSTSGSSRVYAYGYAFVNAYGHGDIESFNSNVVHKFGGCSSRITNANVVEAKGVEPSLESFKKFYPTETKENGKMRWYKTVRKIDGKFIANYDKKFEYRIGETVKENVDYSESNTCGGGIHISGKQWALDFGKNWPDCALLELEVDPSHIFVSTDTDGKVRCSEALVVREVPKEEWNA